MEMIRHAITDAELAKMKDAEARACEEKGRGLERAPQISTDASNRHERRKALKIAELERRIAALTTA